MATRDEMLSALDDLRLEITTHRILRNGRPLINGPQRWEALAVIGDEDFDDRLSAPLTVSGLRFSMLSDLDVLAGSAEASVFLPLVDRETGGLHDDVDSVGTGSDLLLVTHIHERREWQNIGQVGRTLFGRILQELSCRVGLVALHAHPSTHGWNTTPDKVEMALPILLAAWGHLGFSRFRTTQIMTLNPESTAFPEAVERLWAQIGSRLGVGESN